MNDPDKGDTALFFISAIVIVGLIYGLIWVIVGVLNHPGSLSPGG